MTNAAYNDFTLDATGRDNISLISISKFGLRFNWDTDNNFTGVWASGAASSWESSFADTAGTPETVNDPKLVVTFTPGPRGNFLAFM